MFWIGDLVVFPEFRNQGLGKALCAAIVDHPKLAGLSGLLSTLDAHGLYRQFGFENTITTMRKSV
jgi:predicted N-acetyltransferase YhbS